MAERVWVVHVKTWDMRLMYAVDAKEAVRLGDYAYAPVGGYDPPLPAVPTALPLPCDSAPPAYPALRRVARGGTIEGSPDHFRSSEH